MPDRISRESLIPRRLTLTLRQQERLERLHRRYQREPLPQDLPVIVQERLDIALSSRYGHLTLANPFLVAPGPASDDVRKVEKAAECGWGGIVLPTVAAEEGDGRCNLAGLRVEVERQGPSSAYRRDDARRARPALTWNGKLDHRTLDEFAVFVRGASEALAECRTCLIGSFEAGADCAGESHHTAAVLSASGAEAVEMLLRASPTASQMECANAAEGVGFRLAPGLRGSDGRLSASLIPKFAASSVITIDLRTGLRLAESPFAGEHFAVVESLWRAGGCVSAAGGVYSGREALEHILNGAASVQVCSFLAGKVRAPLKRSLNKYEQVLHALLLDPADGLVAALLHLKNVHGIRSVAEAVGLAHKIGQ